MDEKQRTQSNSPKGRNTTARNAGSRHSRKNDRIKKRGKDSNKTKSRGMIFVILAVIIVIPLLLFKGCSDNSLAIEAPDYEESGSTPDKPMADDSKYSKRVNLAVMGDYTVNKDFPDFSVAYPDQNHFDIELSFQDKDGNELYRTKRIRAGTEVIIPGYSFTEKGKNQIDVVVGVYDPDSWELLNEATKMEITITKE